MERYIRSIALLLLAALFAAAPALAQDDPNSGPPRIDWLQPTQDAKIVGRDITLKYSIQGDPNGPLSTLDHIHYNVAPFPQAEAAPGKFTSVGVSGIQDINIDAAIGARAEPGLYQACTYMANAVHERLSQPNCITFTLLFSGVELLVPQNGETLKSYSNNDIAYTIFGEPGVVAVRYIIDNGPVQSDTSASGTISLPILADGAHTLKIWGEDSNGALLGEVTEATFFIRAALGPTSVLQLKTFISLALASKSDLASRQAFLNMSYQLILDMKAASPTDKDPLYKKLTPKNAKKLEKTFLKASRYIAKEKKFKKYAKSMLSLLKKMEKASRPRRR